MSSVPMSLAPDPDALRAHAARSAAHAAAVRRWAARLAGRLATLAWAGPAATAFRSAARRLVAVLDAAAGRLAGVAATLRRHAERVATAEAELGRVAHRVRELAA